MIGVHRTRRCVEQSNVAGRTRCDHDLRQSKVENLRVTALGDEEIGWFDVAVNYAFGMRCVEGVGNLDSQIQNLLGFHGPSLDAMLEGLALKQFHRYEGLAFFFTDVVNCADVGMIEG